MGTLGHIRYVTTEELGAVLHSLTVRGLTFNVTKENGDDATWNIELTGGY